MTSLDAGVIRESASDQTREKLARLAVFAEVESTNSYLLQRSGPAPGEISVAVTTNQTAGRGRFDKKWLSPPGSGLCLSVAYTFARRPENLPALTLALGLGAIAALEELGATNVQLKWPNDLVALESKLGGILTEVQPQSKGDVTVVAGIGVNVDLKGNPEIKSDWARQVVDLGDICEELPKSEQIAGTLMTHLLQAFIDFEKSGLTPFADRWPRYDWLLGREIVVDTAQDRITGVGAGIANDGSLAVDTPESGIQRVTSGTVLLAGGELR